MMYFVEQIIRTLLIKKAFIFPRGRNGRMCKIKKLSLIQ